MTSNKRVLANGVFDIIHRGHITHLRQAAKLGVVTVAVTQDEFVNKGPGRPLHVLADRLSVVFEMKSVYSVVDCRNALHALQMIKPDIFVKGPDYVGKIEPEHEEYCRANGIEIRFTTGEKLSSTAIYDRLK